MLAVVVQNVEVALHAGATARRCSGVLLLGLLVALALGLDKLLELQCHSGWVVPEPGSDRADALQQEGPPYPVLFWSSPIINIVKVYLLDRISDFLLCNQLEKRDVFGFGPCSLLNQRTGIEHRKDLNGPKVPNIVDRACLHSFRDRFPRDCEVDRAQMLRRSFLLDQERNYVLDPSPGRVVDHYSPVVYELERLGFSDR